MTVFPLVKEPQIALFVVSIVFAVINIPFVVLRFAARRRSWGRFNLSDAALLAAFVSDDFEVDQGRPRLHTQCRASERGSAKCECLQICTTALCGMLVTGTYCSLKRKNRRQCVCSNQFAETLIAAVGWHAFEAATKYGLDFVKAVGQVSRFKKQYILHFQTNEKLSAECK